MTGRDATIRTLVSRGDSAGLLRIAGYRKRFGSWWRAKGTLNAPAARVDAIGGLVEVLESTPDPDILDLLRRDIAADSEPAVRAKCARALGELGDAAALSTLNGLLADSDPLVQSAAAAAMAGIPDAVSPEVVDALAASGLSAAVITLAAIRDASKVKEDKDRIGAALRLTAAGDPASYVEAIDELRDAATRAPLGTEGRRRKQLIEILGDPALRATAELLLENLAEDPHWLVVLDAVANAGSQAAGAAAEAVAGDGTALPGSRRDALRVMDRLGVAAHPSLCIELLCTGDHRLVAEAERRLEQAGPAAFGPLLDLVLNAEADSRSRIAAMRLLPAAGDGYAGALADLVLSDHLQVGRAAAQELDRLDNVPESDLLQLGIWLVKDDAPLVLQWLSEHRAELEVGGLSEVSDFLLKRLAWLSEGAAVDIAEQLLVLGVAETNQWIQRLTARLDAMVSKPDDTYQEVEAGDRDMYTVTRTESHEQTRVEGRRLLDRLENAGGGQQMDLGDL